MILVPSSLRNRLVLGAAVVGLAFAVVFGVVATWRVGNAEDQAISAELLVHLDLARDAVAPNGSIAGDADNPKTDLVQVIGPDGRIRASSSALRALAPLVDVAAVQASSTGITTHVTLQSPDVDLSVYAVPIALTARGRSPAGTGALVVALDTEGFNTATSQLLRLLIAGLLAVVLAMAGLAWVLTGRALDSVARITEDAEAVGTDDLATGLPVPLGDVELARLVEALNRMLVRLHEGHAAELAFAADAGHRLRTPVATLRAEAELALRESDPDEVRGALERVVQDADQLTSIVERMLARSRPGRAAPESVVQVLAAASEQWHRRATLARVTFSLHVDELLTDEVRCVELGEALDPIVDNALRHTPPSGAISLSAVRDADGMLVVTVSNTGEPIVPDLRTHVFEAWVSTRDASVAGGLGLWLARATAREAGGDVELVEDASATVFRLRLPVV